jgi:hypothetical protein
MILSASMPRMSERFSDSSSAMRRSIPVFLNAAMIAATWPCGVDRVDLVDARMAEVCERGSLDFAVHAMVLAEQVTRRGPAVRDLCDELASRIARWGVCKGNIAVLHACVVCHLVQMPH